MSETKKHPEELLYQGVFNLSAITAFTISFVATLVAFASLSTVFTNYVLFILIAFLNKISILLADIKTAQRLNQSENSYQIHDMFLCSSKENRHKIWQINTC